MTTTKRKKNWHDRSQLNDAINMQATESSSKLSVTLRPWDAREHVLRGDKSNSAKRITDD